ncbi:hypothetical protein KC19_3G191000 [Ceratodon purpureus]|uniref:Kinesin motor domain-containing protein n=1 Tax=Ceratodon purpureus TaxID=3225 RepID=A0A8T0IMJ4_CERPU|nr:hypothetical protein KC19_3G191000 [Ceratodon purpureus]
MAVDNRNGPEGVAPAEEGGSLVEKEALQAVQVALNIRPLIALERAQGCKDCITAVPGEPQVQLGSHSFTFDYVFGSTAAPLSGVFDRCVKSLCEGLFHGYNATVLAYGQTGSGKTYTMGTGYTVGGSTDGVIPQVMDFIFKKIETLKKKADFQIRVSFIEILKEEVHDLLDPNPPVTEAGFGGGSKTTTVGKPPIQIRETSNGGITLAGVTETDVKSLEEMAGCLEQGSLCRATASTNMNSQSSRSHAIFTITVEQRRKWDIGPDGSNPLLEDCNEDYLCAKLHLVDLAGSERAKRTGADGLRFREGVHINKGLLALGNVISALGDDKKRKEGGHVPYRDSKLTRLLQDSLGGNSSTVMIACVSPADSNAEETLNTLKYANRARNIQNKPTVNRDPMVAEMQRLRQQLEMAHVELICARAGGPSSSDVQMFNQKISWLEASNLDLRRELDEAQERIASLSRSASESQVERDKLRIMLDQLRSGKTFEELDRDSNNETSDLLKEYVNRIQELEAEVQQLHRLKARPGTVSRPLYSLPSNVDRDSASEAVLRVPGVDGDVLSPGEVSGEVEADFVAKELEYTSLQEDLDKELQDLNKRLEQKEAEMKCFVRTDALVLKQHFEKKLVEVEEEKKHVEKERDKLMTEVETLANVSDENARKLQEQHTQKLSQLEAQIADLRKKQENQAQLLRQKQRSEEAAKRLQDEIVRMKTQKVQIQQKMKQESEQFRMWKAAREKEVLQLKKEGRRNVYELHKIQALHLRQKMVLQRKTEEAATAMRRLKELQEARKSSRETAPNGTLLLGGPSTQNNEKTLQHWLEQELEMALRVHEVRSAVEKQREERAATAKELMELRQQEQDKLAIASDPDEDSNARHARITYLESLLSSSSRDMVAMASQLSEAEERERASSGRARWQHLRSMGDAKTLLHLMFGVASYSRCRFKDLEDESKELKEKLAEVEGLLKQTEAQRQELERKNLIANHALSDAVRRACQPVTKSSDKPPRQSEFGANGPYGLRQTAREPTSFRQSIRESDMDLSDSESDFDLDADLSDLDSDSEEENKASRRRVARKTITGSRVISGGRKHLPVNRRSGTNSLSTVTSSEPEQAGISVFSDGAPVEVKDDSKSGHNGSGLCCSCSPWSGCKTKKCSCKALGGFCGPQCGCKVGRCANRLELVTEEIPVLAPGQTEMATAMAGLRVNSPRVFDQMSTPPISGSILSIGGAKSEGDQSIPSPETERALVKKVVTMLDSAWKDSQRGSVSPEERSDFGGVESVEMQDGQRKDSEVGTKRPRRPLSDIGNKNLTKPRADRPLLKPKRKIPRGLVQLVTVPSPSPQQSGPGAGTMPTATSVPAAGTPLNVDTRASAGLTHTSVRDRLNSLEAAQPSLNSRGHDVISAVEGSRESVVPPRMVPTSHRTPHSPLKLRDNTLAAIGFSSQNSEVDASTSNGRRKEVSNRPGDRKENHKEAGDQKENFRTSSRRL